MALKEEGGREPGSPPGPACARSGRKCVRASVSDLPHIMTWRNEETNNSRRPCQAALPFFPAGTRSKGRDLGFSATKSYQNLPFCSLHSQFWIISVRVGSNRASDPLHMGTSCDKEPGNPSVTTCTRTLDGTLTLPVQASRRVTMGWEVRHGKKSLVTDA